MTKVELPTGNTALVPIKQRPMDWFFVAFLFYFGLTSTFGDSTPALGPPSPDSWWFMSRAIYKFYALHTDPLVMQAPTFVRVACFFASYMFAPLHFLMAYGMYKGSPWVRTPALIWSGAMFEGSMVFIWAAQFGDADFFARVCVGGSGGYDYKAQDMLKMWLFNGWYILIPALLMWRLWKDNSFGPKQDKLQA